LNRIYCYGLESQAYTVHERENEKLAIGRVRISSTITYESAVLSFAVLRLGNHRVRAGVRETSEDTAYLASVNELVEAFRKARSSETTLRFDEAFGNQTHSLSSLFKDEQRKILDLIVGPLTAEAEAAHVQLYGRSSDLMRFLVDLRIPLPKTFRASAQFALNHRLRNEFLSAEPSLPKVAPLIEEAKAIQVEIDVPTLEYALRKRLEEMAEKLLDSESDSRSLSRFRTAVELARSLPFSVNLWQVQNLFYEQFRVQARTARVAAKRSSAAAPDWSNEFAQLGETLLFTPEALHLISHSPAAD
jgi:hypothetical protein